MNYPAVFCRLIWVTLSIGALATSVSGASVRPPAFSELVQRADCVVLAETTGVRSEWRGAGPGRHIVTLVTVHVVETAAGTASGTLELVFLGGIVGDETWRVADQPLFHAGDRDILFVEKNGRQICPLVAMMYGRYPVVRDPADAAQELVMRQNGEALTSVADVVRPLAESTEARATSVARAQAMLEPLTAAAFMAAIRRTARELGRTDIAP